ncbi:MBL fold metallo-hydrolase [Lunatibacter salilacus]|uniref:MBL fold metallo-hydrolase n=1 Tax=Lunatibacter salilacus TaxID=2483804 RepID=UPI001F2A4B6D|nr:MBL fold metallo-hydrolase [Lunatibacter salilacus]
MNSKQTIGCFLIPSESGVVLVECGPESTFPMLKKGIEDVGYSLDQVRHVLLTHIHFDHAGAAWKLANEGAKIYVHPIGLPHLASPEKLWNSAAQIYGENMDKLWGKMESIPKELLVAVEHEEVLDLDGLRVKAWHTPGHAVHHIAWEIGELLFTGDVAGVKIAEGPVVPPCPPPDINIEEWKRSINLIKTINPQKMVLTHFGEISLVHDHLQALEEMLDDWSYWMKPKFDMGLDPQEIIPEFMAYTTQQMLSLNVSDETRNLYEFANPSWMSVAGLMRYWKLKSQGRI